MTRDQIATRVRDNLNDAGITYYSLADIHDSIQDGYDEVAVYCECIERNEDIDLVSDTTYYDLSTLIPDYYRVTSVYHNTANFFLDPLSERELFSGRSDWELAANQEREFVILGPKYLGISGRSANATGSFKVYYKAQADTLVAASTPRINDAYQILLENYATADLLEQNEEYVKASKYWDKYAPMLEDYRAKIQLLSKSDRIFARGQVSYYGD